MIKNTEGDVWTNEEESPTASYVDRRICSIVGIVVDEDEAGEAFDYQLKMADQIQEILDTLNHKIETSTQNPTARLKTALPSFKRNFYHVIKRKAEVKSKDENPQLEQQRKLAGYGIGYGVTYPLNGTKVIGDQIEAGLVGILLEDQTAYHVEMVKKFEELIDVMNKQSQREKSIGKGK